MKKILAVVLILVLAVCFAACNKNKGDDETTSNFLSASFVDPVVDDTSDSTEDVSASQDGNTTLLLTTQAGETMPSVPTTAFDPSSVTVGSTTSVDPGSLTVPTMTAPSVVTSQQPFTYSTVNGGTVPPYITTTRTTTYNIPTPSTANYTTTTRPTTAPTTTTSATRSSKTVVINDYATTSDKKLVVTIDPAGWDGKFQNNSQNITVKVDGVAKSAPCTVKSSAKNADGYQYITIDLGELSVPEGANVQFTVPAAFLQTASGAQYNSAFSGAYTMM